MRARAFYEGVLGLEPIYSDYRLTAYPVAGRDVLLVFRKGHHGANRYVLPSGTIPGHRGDGALHVAFAIGRDELDRWETHLASRGVKSHREGETIGNAWRAQHLIFATPTGTFGACNAGFMVGVLGANIFWRFQCSQDLP